MDHSFVLFAANLSLSPGHRKDHKEKFEALPGGLF
jgi:hypothetical protein